MRRLALAIGLVVLVASSAAPARAEPDDLDFLRRYPLDRSMDPHWRREHQADLAKLAALEARKRAADKRRRRRKPVRVVPPAPHPAP